MAMQSTKLPTKLPTKLNQESGCFLGSAEASTAISFLLYEPEFKPLFESKQDAFWVTLWNMNYVNGSATGQVGTQDSPHVSPHVDPHVSQQVERLLAALGEGELSSADLMAAMGFSDRSSFQQNYLKPALESTLVEMTIPDRPPFFLHGGQPFPRSTLSGVAIHSLPYARHLTTPA